MNRRALVVDDERDMRLLLRTRLARSGWSVDAVGSGEEALDRWRASDYDVVVLDQRMDGMSGLETAGRLRGLGYQGPIVIFSAYIEPAIEEAAGEMGITTIGKSSIRELDERLHQIAAGSCS